jgi:hypothetical protein
VLKSARKKSELSGSAPHDAVCSQKATGRRQTWIGCLTPGFDDPHAAWGQRAGADCQLALDGWPTIAHGWLPGPGWPHFGRTTALNAADDCAPLITISAGQQGCRQVVGAAVDLYGSEGWGFESLRARPAHRPFAVLAGAYFVVLGATSASQPPNRARLIDSAAARLSPSSRWP